MIKADSLRPQHANESMGTRLSSKPELTLRRPNHLHPRRMPAALEPGSRERIDDIERQPFAYHASANRQHAGIVVLADHAG